MKKILAAAGIGAALFAGSLGVAGTASADVTRDSNGQIIITLAGSKGDQSAVDYRRDLSDAGLNARLDQAAYEGPRICDQLSSGMSENAIGVSLLRPPNNWLPVQARVGVKAAEYHFCPQYYGN